MKNIVVQFDGDKYRLFQSTQQNELLGVVHSLDEVKTILSDQFSRLDQFSKPAPKVGDPYWYVYFGEDFRTGGCAEVRNARLRQTQIDYYDRYHQLPTNVYISQSQAANAMQRLTALFKDLRGKWELNGLDGRWEFNGLG